MGGREGGKRERERGRDWMGNGEREGGSRIVCVVIVEPLYFLMTA